MTSNEENGYWEEFIEIYRENPCLWDTKCSDFKNQSKRDIAYGLLIEKLWEIDDDADMETVKKKIQSYNMYLRREVSKIKRSKEDGQNYVPTWYFYKSLSFLIPFVEENVTIPNSDTKLNATEISSSTEPIQHKAVVPPQEPDIVVLNKSPLKNSPPSKKRKLSNVTKDDDWDDDCSTFVAHLKTRMRSFDPLQKCIAQKLISDVMFMAETKQLQLTTAISNLPQK